MTIIFFFPNILRDAHRHIFQLDRLKKEGYEIILLDATKYFGNDGATATEKIILEHKIECRNKSDFLKFRKELPEQPVIFVAFDFYTTFAAPVFDIIIRRKDKLLTYFTKRFSSVLASSGTMTKLMEQALPLFSAIIPWYFFRFFYQTRFKMHIPDYYLCSTEHLVPPKIRLSVKKSNVIVVHADDINHVLRKRTSVVDPQKRVGVFLDQGIPFLNRTHPNFYPEPIPQDYFNRYYRRLEETLSDSKEKLGLDEIVIALHPNTVKFEHELKGKFGQFRSFIGVTQDLVRDASIVFGHCSTAFSFVVYHQKPAVVLVDNFLLNYHPKLRENILFFAEELGMKTIDMDKEMTLKGLSEVPLDLDMYRNYTSKYLKDNDIQENSYYYAIERIRKDLNEQYTTECQK